MMIEHLTDDVLIAALYGVDVGLPTATHLSSCSQCRARLEAMGARKLQVADEGSVSDEMLREQRLRVHARMERERVLGYWLRPVPALAAVLVIAAGLVFRAPAPAPVQTGSSESDAQFFTEIAAVVDQQGPRAADPIRGLFEEAARQ